MEKILVTSVGEKIPLIECIRNTSELLIVGIDIKETIAQNFLDDFLKVNRLEEIDIENFISVCKDKKIKYILPTREEDLVFFSKNKKELLENGIFTMVSDLKSIGIVNDKFLFYQKLFDANLNVIPIISEDDLKPNMKYVLKERFGAGSKNILLDIGEYDVKRNLYKLNSPIIQPYISGKEYSIDLYVTKNKKIKSVVSRERVLVVNGESQITKVISNPKLEQLISEAVLLLELEGHVMFQAIEDEQGVFWIIECNARIGGASTLSIYAGLDSFNWWVAECNDENIEDWPFEIKELKQIRYKKDLIF